MKKFFFVLAIFVLTSTAFVSAAPGSRINDRVIASFQKQFSGATDIRWTVNEDVVKANFVYLNNRTEAYYNQSGELIGTARTILFSQLPMAVTKAIDKRYGAAPVYEVVEYCINGETSYGMTVELSKKKVSAKATSDGDVWVEKISKK